MQPKTTQDVTNELKEEIQTITGQDYFGKSNHFVIDEMKRIFVHYRYIQGCITNLQQISQMINESQGALEDIFDNTEE